MQGYYAADKGEAPKFARSLIPEDLVVTMGGGIYVILVNESLDY